MLFGLFAYAISYLTMKSIVLRRFFMGTPTILIQDGKILEKNLKKMKFDINDMLEEIRSAGYFDLSQVEYAVLEANGEVSILPKSEYRPLTPKDMDIKVPKEVSTDTSTPFSSKTLLQFSRLRVSPESSMWLWATFTTSKPRSITVSATGFGELKQG